MALNLFPTIVPGKREASPLLFCLAFFFFPVTPATAAVWYLNDARTEGDSLTRAIGNDRSGDGSAAKPFRSLKRALQMAKDGDHILLDTGDYAVPSSAQKEAAPISLSRLTLEGNGPEKTRFHAQGKVGLAFARTNGVRLEEFSVIGGDTSLVLDQCSDFTLTHLQTSDSATYGILLKDSAQNKIVECLTSRSRFQGLQLRRSRDNLLRAHVAPENTNAGICLESAAGNLLENCSAENNGMSGFYFLRKTERNRVKGCLAAKNKFVGFYLDIGSTANELLENESRQNDRGFTLSGAPNNVLKKNRALSNRSFGFWIKDKSPQGQFRENRANSNGDAGFVFSPDSVPAFFNKNLSTSNRAPDRLVPPPAWVSAR